MNSDRLTLFAHVLLPLAVPGTLTYRIPEELNEWVITGKRVIVQVGKRKLYTGIVTGVTEEVPKGFEAKYIHSILDDVPVVTQNQLDYWYWMANYYMCTPGEVMKAALPAALKLESESVLVLSDSFDPNLLYDPEEEILLRYLEAAAEIRIDAAAALIKKHSVYKIIKSLYQKGAVLIKEDISEQYKPKKIKCLRIHPDLNESDLKVIFDKLEKRSVKQLQALMALYAYKPAGAVIERADFLRDAQVAPAILKALEEKGIVSFYEVDKMKAVHAETQSLPELSGAQLNALNQITNAWQHQDVCLLFGHTASGKTHLYFHLMQEAIRKGHQVLYMVPEMALTAHLVRRIKRYFGDLAEVTHSGFSMNERYETWNQVSAGITKVVLGVRSSVFMPFKNLGLIIVDEEHETTLKQQDPAPRYHARESAAMLARSYGAKVLLGSATPSVESWYNAHKGKYGFATLTEKYGGATDPEIRLVNLTEAIKGGRMKGPFSSELIQALEQVIAAKKQAIVFQNRRGYVPVTECTVCGWTPKCVNCDVSLTYFHSTGNYRCNFCGFKHEIFKECTACGSTRLKLIGYGTERLEEELKILLPTARIARFDSETTRSRKQMELLLDRFEKGETDILVGTQMLSKGLDFENLEMVAVIHADHLINFPDFRSVERSFQLLVQVSGRAGRRGKPGSVMVQTHQPWHKVLEALKTHQIEPLYEWELQERAKFLYPPFTRVIRITLKNTDAQLVSKAAQQLAQNLRTLLGDKVLGPEVPYISKIRNLYLYQILIKFDPNALSPHKLKQFVSDQIHGIRTHASYKKVWVTPDVDPYF